MVSGAMQFRRTEERNVVVLPKILHELRCELLRRQTAETAVLKRDNDVKTAVRIGDLGARLHAPKNRSRSYSGDPQRFADILSAEVIPPSGTKVGDEFGRVSHSQYFHKVTYIVTLCKP